MLPESGCIVVPVNVHAFCAFGLILYACYWYLDVLENIRPFTLIMDSDVMTVLLLPINNEP
jgi:hypothetical protein